MIKKSSLLGILLLFALSPVSLKAEGANLSEVNWKDLEEAVEVRVVLEGDSQIVVYPLFESPRIIVDFIPDVSSNLPEEFKPEWGKIKQIKLTPNSWQKDEEGYYSVDFLAIELEEMCEFKAVESEEGYTIFIAKGEGAPASREKRDAAEEKEEVIQPEEAPVAPPEEKPQVPLDREDYQTGQARPEGKVQEEAKALKEKLRFLEAEE